MFPICYAETNATSVIPVLFVCRVLRSWRKNCLMARNFKDRSLPQKLILCLKVKLWRTGKALFVVKVKGKAIL
jgi:hypothetical protein